METTRTDETILLERLKQGDTAAFEKLFHLYWKPMYEAAFKRLHDRQEAEDIVQDVLAGVWKKRATLIADKNGSLASYLFTALRYRIISFYAGVRMERFQGEVLERLLQLHANDHVSVLITKELQQLLQQELNSMPEKMRQAYRLTRDHDYSIRDTATALNLSEQTVKNLITASTKRLRQVLQHYYSHHTPEAITLMALTILLEVTIS